MKLNILTPFYRKENFDILRKRHQQFNSWTCIVTESEHFNSYGEFFKNKKCKHMEYVCGDFVGDAAYCKVNRYIIDNAHNIKDEEYYMFIMDDDSMSINFMENLRARDLNSMAIIVSAKRGQRRPRRLKYMVHDTADLIADKKNMKPGKLAFCQQIVCGDVLKRMRFREHHPSADGLMGPWLTANVQDITYLKDLFVWFNYLERGRYIINLL